MADQADNQPERAKNTAKKQRALADRREHEAATALIVSVSATSAADGSEGAPPLPSIHQGVSALSRRPERPDLSGVPHRPKLGANRRADAAHKAQVDAEWRRDDAANTAAAWAREYYSCFADYGSAHGPAGRGVHTAGSSTQEISALPIRALEDQAMRESGTSQGDVEGMRMLAAGPPFESRLGSHVGSAGEGVDRREGHECDMVELDEMLKKLRRKGAW